MGRRQSCMAGGGGQPFRTGKARALFDVVVKGVEIKHASCCAAAAICVMEATCRRFLRKTAKTQGILRLWLLSTPQPPVTIAQALKASAKRLGGTRCQFGDWQASCGRAARSGF